MIINANGITLWLHVFLDTHIQIMRVCLHPQTIIITQSAQCIILLANRYPDVHVCVAVLILIHVPPPSFRTQTAVLYLNGVLKAVLWPSVYPYECVVHACVIVNVPR